MCVCKRHWFTDEGCTCPCDHAATDAATSEWDGSAEHEAPYLYADADPPFGLSEGAFE